MTAPESTPQGSPQRAVPNAEAIARIQSLWISKFGNSYSMDQIAYRIRHGVELPDALSDFLIGLEQMIVESAAIQRGDGQTDTVIRASEFVAKTLGVLPDTKELNHELHEGENIATALVRHLISMSAAQCEIPISFENREFIVSVAPRSTPPAAKPCAKPNETSGATPIVVTVSPGEKPMSAETGTAIKEMVTLAAMQVQLSGADKALEIERAHVARLQAELNAVRAAGAEGAAALPAVLAAGREFVKAHYAWVDDQDSFQARRVHDAAEAFSSLLERIGAAAKSTPGVDIDEAIRALETMLREFGSYAVPGGRLTACSFARQVLAKLRAKPADADGASGGREGV